MQQKNSKKILIVMLAGLATMIAVLFYLRSQKQKMNSPVVVPVVLPEIILQKQEQAPLLARIIFGEPVRLKIPGIQVDTFVERIGVTAGGAMDVPKGPVDVAWFKFGPRPGEIGSAVISGHYGWGNGIPAVFDNLHLLKKGDKIYIEDDKGAIIIFIVRESRRYDLVTDASDVFISEDGKSHLNFVTCEGVWDKVSKSYSKRLVVFTDKIE